MRRSLTYSLSIVIVLIGLSVAALGQRTTGAIEGTVKDPKGAVVPGANITVSGLNVGFSRTIQANDEGYFRMIDVPAGNYNVAVAASGGFAATTVQTTVAIEKTSTTDITVGIGQSLNVVQVENDPLGVNIDVSDSKVQTTITSELIDKLPTGTSFTSLLKISPATRPEPLSGGFQVDGASGSENTFLIDGVPMENFRTGTLNGVNNIPTSLVNEVQIKTGGFEAEHGGASGGVISVATKSGSDLYHVNAGTSFESSKWQPNPRFIPQRFQNNPSCVFPGPGTPPVPANIVNDANKANCLSQFAANPQFQFAIFQPKPQYLNNYPDLQFSGPVIKHHLWFLGQWSPQSFDQSQTSTFYNAVSTSSFSTGNLVLVPRSIPVNPIAYHVNQTFNYGYSRVDASFWNKVRVNASYLWNPSVTKGAIPFAIVSQSTPTDTLYGGVNYPSGEYTKLQGGRTNANTFNTGGTYTPTSNLIISARYSQSFLNEKARHTR